MSLGDYIRVAKTFVEAFKVSEDNQEEPGHSEPDKPVSSHAFERAGLRHDIKVGDTLHPGV